MLGISGCSHAHCVQRQVPWMVMGCRKLRNFRSCSLPGRRHSLRDAEVHPHGLCDHGDSAVTLRYGGQWPFIAGRAVPCCDAEADPHGPDCLSDHRDSPVASHGVRCPVVQGVLVVDIPVVVQRPIPMVLPVWKTKETPLCSTFPGGRCPCCAG